MTTPTVSMPAGQRPRLPLWVSGDTNAFFGLGFNVLVNVLVLTSLCLTVVHIPGREVFGVILPALGIQLLIGNVYYTYLARRLARRENRADVCAMPYGPSVPHMFIVTFVIMLPTYLATKNPRAGLGGGPGLGVHYRHHRADRRLHRPGHPPVLATGGASRHPRRRLDRLHLDAAGRPDVGGGLDRPAGAGDHPVRLPHRPEAAGQHPDRARRAAGRDRDRLDRRLHVPARRRRRREGHRDQPADPAHRPARPRAAGGLAAACHRHPARHLQLHRGHDQRGERGGGGRQVQPAEHPAGRRDRRHRRRGARVALPARRLHRPPRLEGGRRPDQLLDAERRGHRPAVLPWHVRAARRR